MPVATLNGRTLTTWDGFHRASREAFGFPDFYGNNLSAWIDCMSGLRDDDQMTRFHLEDDAVLEIVVDWSGTLAKAAPEILRALQECVAEVNLRCAEAGQSPVLTLRLQ